MLRGDDQAEWNSPLGPRNAHIPPSRDRRTHSPTGAAVSEISAPTQTGTGDMTAPMLTGRGGGGDGDAPAVLRTNVPQAASSLCSWPDGVRSSLRRRRHGTSLAERRATGAAAGASKKECGGGKAARRQQPLSSGGESTNATGPGPRGRSPRGEAGSSSGGDSGSGAPPAKDASLLIVPLRSGTRARRARFPLRYAPSRELR